MILHIKQLEATPMSQQLDWAKNIRNKKLREEAREWAAECREYPFKIIDLLFEMDRSRLTYERNILYVYSERESIEKYLQDSMHDIELKILRELLTRREITMHNNQIKKLDAYSKLLEKFVNEYEHGAPNDGAY